jgi:hypothetical protein
VSSRYKTEEPRDAISKLYEVVDFQCPARSIGIDRVSNGVVRDFDADAYLLKNPVASAISRYRNPDPRGLTLVR